MQTDTTPTLVLYPTEIIERVFDDRLLYIALQSKLNYMVSRLRAALHAFADDQQNRDKDKDMWWLTGFQHELVIEICSFWPVPWD
jgi:hypothetical protein